MAVVFKLVNLLNVFSALQDSFGLCYFAPHFHHFKNAGGEKNLLKL